MNKIFFDSDSNPVNADDYAAAVSFVSNIKFGHPVNLGYGEYVLGLHPSTDNEIVMVLKYGEDGDDAYFNICSFGMNKKELLNNNDFFRECLINGDVNHAITKDIANIDEVKQLMKFFNDNDMDAFPCTYYGAVNYVDINLQSYVKLRKDVAHSIFAMYGMKVPDENVR